VLRDINLSIGKGEGRRGHRPLRLNLFAQPVSFHVGTDKVQ
jgi:hypothetical protein